MAEATKHLPVGGGAFMSDFKTFSPLLKTRRTMVFAYGFMFAFVAFTVFMFFNPSSNSDSPWFTNIFSTTSSATASTFSDESYRSQFSSIFSYFFPNSSQADNKFISSPIHTNASSSHKVHNFTTPPVQTNTSRSDVTLVQFSKTNKQRSSTKNQTNGEVPKSNHAAIAAPKTPLAVNKTANSQAKSSPQGEKNSGKEEKRAAPLAVNKTANSPAKSSSQGEKISGKEEKRVAEKGVVSNLTASLKKQSNGTSSSVSEKQGKKNLLASLMNCNIFYGEWVKDDSYPLYKPGSCSLIDEQFNCVLNGRPDKDYQKLKWKPKGCNLPRLNGRHMLDLLRGKRLVFVGDSLNRNMWESLVCILRNSVKDKSKVFEASGRYQFRTEASYSFIFKDYNCSVEFFVSPFLVQEWEMPDKNGSKKETLRLDIIGRSSDEYKAAEIIIFNTGHWWTHEKTSKGRDYYQEGSHVYGELNVVEAFRRALTTWGRWVDANVNPAKSLVFFRGYSASHFSGGQWNSGGQCDSETEPIRNETYLSEYPPKMRVLESVLKGMKTHVTYMNITRMTDYRKDGHPSIYRKQSLTAEERRSPLSFQDCSHWCLPGVPDAWNELLYAELVIKQSQKQQQQQKRS